ncbi:hypothetical protein CTI12_AA547600 [Artemisia annua]|uniref:Uncharacterized protein n=1 Tax=Artemisia annua TaxID=35608 RepID=A0A2U1KZI6_ARTAN|nr:hypothetical protein CTI12_AA547600 [Artemisia annua]
MSKEQRKPDEDFRSLSKRLHKSLVIHSETIVIQHGKLQRPSYLRATSKTLERAAFASSGVAVVYHDIGPPSFACPNCKAFMWYEERCQRDKSTRNPVFSLCCQRGKVLLPKFRDAPPPLNKLMDYNNPASSRFKDQIRVYNECSINQVQLPRRLEWPEIGVSHRTH